MSRLCIVLLAFVSIVADGFIPVVFKHRRLNPVRIKALSLKVTGEPTSLSVVQESGISNLSSSAPSATIDPPIRNTIVFDIDDTLCLRKSYPGWSTNYYFYPNWKVLFDYLMANNCFIAIYSSGGRVRNAPMMKNFLNFLYRRVKYRRFVRNGQFKVYSREDKHRYFRYKTLAPILRANQTLENVILIDDHESRANPTEPEMILVKHNFRHNIVSGLLGMFMTYFENKPQNETLRGFVGRVMPLRNRRELSAETEQQYINKGLAEIRKIDREAPYYDETTENEAPHDSWYLFKWIHT